MTWSLDHLVVVADDPSAAAEELARRAGLEWSAEPDVSDDGYRSAGVRVGRGQYVDFLCPQPGSIDPGAPHLFGVTSGTLVGWVLGTVSAEDEGRRLHATPFASTDGDQVGAWFVHWDEAARTRGLLPCFVEYVPPLRPVWERTEGRWVERGGGIVRVELAGDDAARRDVEALLGGEDVDVTIDWVDDGPPGLVAATIRGATGDVELRRP